MTNRSGGVYAYYVSALENCNALDFDDLLLKTVHLFETSAHTRARYSQQFRFVMVDDTRIRTGRRTCWCAGWRNVTGTCASSAIPTSRSTSGAARI